MPSSASAIAFVDQTEFDRADWRGKPAIVVEPGALLRRLIASGLKDHGASTVIAVDSPGQAFDLLDTVKPGLVLVDWSQAEGDEEGLDFIRAARRHDDSAVRTTPFVLMSARNRRADLLAARDAGISEYLLKPVSLKVLLRTAGSAAKPRRFITAPGFAGPDRRRRGRDYAEKLKTWSNPEVAGQDPLTAQRHAAKMLAAEAALDRCPLVARVSASLHRYLQALTRLGPSETEVIEMHRAALSQIAAANKEGDHARAAVVSGLEAVVSRRLGRS
ncbi:MAG: response regulator [Maricaulaceae bacterium]|nr:response regulator [Maricaulaceae bacterium]